MSRDSGAVHGNVQTGLDATQVDADDLGRGQVRDREGSRVVEDELTSASG